MRRVASLASALPSCSWSTSVQPVKRFSLFQVLKPWRSRTSLGALFFFMGSTVVGRGEGLLVLEPFDSQFDQAADEVGVADAARLPQLGIHADLGEAGDGV